MRPFGPGRALTTAFLLLVATAAFPQAASAPISATARIVSRYMERYFDMYPTRATEAGRHDQDSVIEDFSVARIEAWVEFNRETRTALSAAAKGASAEDRLDAGVVRAQIDRELLDLEVLHRRDRDPLFWTAPLSNATVFLLVRDDLRRDQALAAARERVSVIPSLARAAREAFEVADRKAVAPEYARLAAAQASSLSRFYAEGFAEAFPVAEREAAKREAEFASLALRDLAMTLETVAQTATGRAQLGPRYAEVFRVGTGLSEPPASVLLRAERALVAKKREVARYARSVFTEVTGDHGPAPVPDQDVIRRVFAALGDDRDPDLDTYVAGWKRNTVEVERFVRGNKVMTLMDPLTLKIEVSPSYFTGQ
ncbi:MAG: DUF885 family protein, partial [Vicinamibacteria bacterium]